MDVLADSVTTVSPSAWLVLWCVAIWAIAAAGVVAALKGRWGWLAVGLVTAGIGVVVGAFLAPAPDSVWARRRPRTAA